MINPISTYRIQFNKDFNFKDFEDIIPYLHTLGVKTIYASPIFAAVPGSNHGYDGIDPNRINPEIGTIEELRRISARLKTLKMYWIQDIVPNHMGYHQENPWLMDLLKFGEQSVYRNFFDINSEDLAVEPVMAPFIGATLEEVIENGELTLSEFKGEQVLKYFDTIWPLNPETDLQKPLLDIANSQYYRLCSFQESNERINFRRFFTVNSLICLNMQHQETFDAYHRLTKDLLEEGVFQGLRIDHVDGLYDPAGYLTNLRELCGPEAFLVVEKILEPGESLPTSWPIQGTTGYDFLGLVNQVFINEKAEKRFDQFYKQVEEYPSPVQTQIRRKKTDFLFKFMNGELENLFQLFLSLNLVKSHQTALCESEVFKKSIAEILVRCPVYRFYGNQYPLPVEEQEALKAIFLTLKNKPEYEGSVALLTAVLFENSHADKAYGERVLKFYQRLMQFTGPLMAKGVEDTLMYTYNRFIGSNEVGDSPDVFGISVADFHDAMIERQAKWPLTMNTSSTHDTKRGEDARARLQVLTDLRKEWLEEVKIWQELNLDLKQADHPDTNDEYFIYQTLLATYPETASQRQEYPDRIQQYMEKALRESKRNSSWDNPDMNYETITKEFIIGLLDQNRAFWLRFQNFLQQVSHFGKLNSLSALLLKFGCPGLPDTYQGDGFWNLNLVDPDNRRAVDYKLREKYLARLKKENPDLKELWEQSTNGLIKLAFIQRLMHLRKQLPQLFSEGSYLPLAVAGKYSKHLIAFARRYQRDTVVFISPVNHTGIKEWGDTHVILPEETPDDFRDILRNEKSSTGNQLFISKVFTDVPLAVLHFKAVASNRSAGILMPVFSLPSAFGIGDFGPEARAFMDFLHASGQKFWQLLPLNPVSASQSYSPYSATSVMAGNINLISPESLATAGLLQPEDLEKYTMPLKKNIKYKKAQKNKLNVIRHAYQNFMALGENAPYYVAFQEFCKNEKYWLDDFALFTAIKELQHDKPWFQWPEGLRNRNEQALSELRHSQHAILQEIKWQQFIFQQQWDELRRYAGSCNIKFIGDLPFYAAWDSADVWANRSLFSLKETGECNGVAGVPPDYFNDEGQLWGMPVYRWEVMKENNFDWWMTRLQKNMQWYDLLRLDHFRAFSAYWEVQADSDTAKNGEWKPGPGKAFFEVLQSKFRQMPFIAEDLGEIDAAVYQLRDQFKLPGMKVLQFAFAEESATSVHLPSQYLNPHAVVYTGTHDNDTCVGWYDKEMQKKDRKRLQDYLGYKVDKKNIHLALIRLAYASVANIAIIPMQDVLGKGSSARMNTPAATKNNWKWRLKTVSQLQAMGIQKLLKNCVVVYGR
ncbi:malto-oligosyltrehalose synthase/4-alpha-glucanotransferase [Pedobacter sp. CAN_A7]|uniref:malto-oligosyltrehalose synthase n=1 Tax=Pedobacter sp. CAN_A7 TaxID=2787722 RepID=UPI0018CA304B